MTPNAEVEKAKHASFSVSMGESDGTAADFRLYDADGLLALEGTLYPHVERLDEERCINLASLIRTALNSHDALVSALQRAKVCIRAAYSQSPVRDLDEIYSEIDAALELAEAES